MAQPDGREQALLGLALAPTASTGAIAAALAEEIADTDAVTAVAHPFSDEDPDELARRLVAVAQTVWPQARRS
jgi:hypothetical protein